MEIYQGNLYNIYLLYLAYIIVMRILYLLIYVCLISTNNLFKYFMFIFCRVIEIKYLRQKSG